jgi:hypothetical protein
MAQGIKTGGRQKGTPNKLTAEIKERLAAIISEATDNFNLEECSNSERLKLIEIGLKYLLPTMKQVDNIHNDTKESIDFKTILRFGDI